MKRLFTFLLVALSIMVIAALLVGRSRSQAHHHATARETQETPEGKPVVEEWGDESFPASDPPQSW